MPNLEDKEMRDMTNNYLSEIWPDAPKCITFDKEAQDNLPPHIKHRMKVNQEKSKYKWQGETVNVEHGICLITENKEKPLWWYNYECIQLGTGALKYPIEAMRVTYGSGENKQVFCISNHCGIGHNKLINGGWPNSSHFSLPIDTFKPDESKAIIEFDLNEFQQYEKNRDDWQREVFADNEDYKRSERLRKALQNKK